MPPPFLKSGGATIPPAPPPFTYPSVLVPSIKHMAETVSSLEVSQKYIVVWHVLYG